VLFRHPKEIGCPEPEGQQCAAAQAVEFGRRLFHEASQAIETTQGVIVK
jgi:hypothetical protein